MGTEHPALVPGSRLGPYEIVAPLGAGGMGEVYRARDGKELFYLAPDRKLMAVAVNAGTTLEVDSPRPLFQTTLDPTAFRQMYAVSADGNRFLLNAQLETVAQPLTVVLNWPALIRVN